MHHVAPRPHFAHRRLDLAVWHLENKFVINLISISRRANAVLRGRL